MLDVQKVYSLLIVIMFCSMISTGILVWVSILLAKIVDQESPSVTPKPKKKKGKNRPAVINSPLNRKGKQDENEA
jgi:hypothetical protein